MVRRTVGVWSWILAGGLLAAILLAGFNYYRVWGPRVVSSAVGEVVFFAALAGLLVLALSVIRGSRRSRAEPVARSMEDSEK